MTSTLELGEDELTQLALLRDFETDALIDAGLLSRDEQLLSPLDRELAFSHDELTLWITAGPSYPAGPVSWRVDNDSLSRVAIIELRADLRNIAESSETTNNIRVWRNAQEEGHVGFEPVMAVLELAKETEKHIRAWREKHQLSVSAAPTPFTMRQVVVRTATSNVAHELLGKTPGELCADIPPCYRVLHVEEVWRTDLTKSFRKKRGELRRHLLEKPLGMLRQHVPPELKHSNRKEDLVDHLVKLRVTFHGTERHRVPSMRHGFVRPGTQNPGTGEAHRALCGSTYGAGIYSSPDADFALSYSNTYMSPDLRPTRPGEYFGLKLIVCAVVMGRSVQVERGDGLRTRSRPLSGADSHVANHGLEYIVFDSARIIPVLVVHIDWGEEHHAAYFANLPSDPAQFVPGTSLRASGRKTHPRLLSNDVLWPGDVQRHKAAVHARAAKYFPHGYGPATGGRFVVEEIGEVDEDEEDYGDFQASRADEAAELKSGDLTFWSWVKAAEEEDGPGWQEGLDIAAAQYADERVAGNWRAQAPRAWNDIPLPRELREEDSMDNQVEESDGGGFDLDRLGLNNS